MDLTVLAFLLVLSPIYALQEPFLVDARSGSIAFQLRHRLGVDDTRIVFSDISQESPSLFAPNLNGMFTIKTQTTISHRPSSFSRHEHVHTRRRSHGEATTHVDDRIEQLAWNEDKIVGPNITDRETLLSLAKMASDAYLENSSDGQWYDLGGWNDSYPFGWNGDGFRGHIFATPDNTTIVVSIKGTSAGLLGGGGPTVGKDKLNDNTLFSCCCARVGWSWSPVCPCYAGSDKCNQDCLETSLADESLFYSMGTNLYYNVSYMYPNSNIWLIGHSLGGALASLLGITFGVPTVAFEAPGDKLAAKRLHLPSPPSTQHVTHVYHTADPIPMGTCNGVLSSCALAGYAFETRCHLGKSIIYDTVSTWGWSVSIRTHAIITVVEQLLAQDWPTQPGGTPSNDSKVPPVPEAKYEDPDCIECYNWEFGNFSTQGLW